MSAVDHAALTEHARRVVKAMADGRVVPLLGAGVNLCGRVPGTPWRPHEDLPSGRELSDYLAEHFDYPLDEARDLVRVSEFAYVMNGSGPLYERLRELFDVDYAASALHHFLASLPARLGRSQLIVTTNYDDALERAFAEAGQPFDVVAYLADGDHRGKFVHHCPDGRTTLIERPNEYGEVSPEQRTVILKVHGAVDRTVGGEWDSFVITEDHYIDYLTKTDLPSLVPINLAASLRRSHFLFLGYSMRDWNLRVILHRIWGEQKLKYKSWAVQLATPAIDREFWERRGVDILDVPLERYVEALDEALDEP
jgi:hypothetical protein